MKGIEVKQAIISVWDKSNLIPLARTLQKGGVRLFATGGTYRKLTEEGITVEKIEDFTGFPEILQGRVKTLHPLIFTGLLADNRKADHRRDLARVNGIPFQLIVVNLYPFSQTYRAGDKSEDEIIEMIDVGGPAMLRAASKNYNNIAVLSDPSQYDEFIQRFEKQNLDEAYLRRLAKAVFIRTAIYDSEIAAYFSGRVDSRSETQMDLPEFILTPYQRAVNLRYGENPDQSAALYNSVMNFDALPFEQLQGKEISYNNYVDCLAAYRLTFEYHTDAVICVNVKHTNPCGCGVAASPLAAYLRAVKADPVSYYGGIVGINRIVDQTLAKEFTKSFLECIVAPGFSPEALEILAKRKNLRLLIPNNDYLNDKYDLKSYGKGLLAQTIQSGDESESNWQVVTKEKPNGKYQEALHLGWHLVKHVKSNAIVLTDEAGSVGVGAGQMARVDALKIALRKAREAGLETKGCVMASDAFFPFRDSIDLAAQAGIRGVIQPGGSVRDNEVIEACDEQGIFMLLTHKRVFKH
jgi:phosphoribosylaminoimidazolecarboxamide formyltransferase/IMP cyclohydrolase